MWDRLRSLPCAIPMPSGTPPLGDGYVRKRRPGSYSRVGGRLAPPQQETTMFATRSLLGPIALAVLVTAMTAVCGDVMAGSAGRDKHKPAERYRHVLIVPTQYPTIQSAVDAAEPGRIVKVLPGTYPEQLVLQKEARKSVV